MGDQNIRYLVTSLLILLSTSLFGQSIPIQLMVVDQNGFEKANHSVKLRLTLTNDTSSNTGQYQEVHFTSTNDFGIVSAALGTGIATTASSYLTFSLFPFTELEPFIKLELDTSLTSSQYFVAGTIKYSYPPIARRALVSDSSQVSSQSYESYHSLKSDTADYLSNFPVPNDNDSTNEIQSISLSQGGYLKLSNSIDSVEVNDNNPANELQSIILTESGYLKLSNSLDSVASGPRSSDLANNNSYEYCFQGNPEVFHLSSLSGYSQYSLRPLVVFDSIAYIGLPQPATTTAQIIRVNLYSGAVTTLDSSLYTWNGFQSDSIGYLLRSNLFYTVDKTGIIDTTSFTGGFVYPRLDNPLGVAYPNSDFSFQTTTAPESGFNYDYSSGTLSSIPSSGKSWEGGQGQAVGSDSVLIANILYNKNTMAVVKTFTNSTNIRNTGFGSDPATYLTDYVYNRKYKKLIYYKTQSWYSQVTSRELFSCDLSGVNEISAALFYANFVLGDNTIDGMHCFTIPNISGQCNGYVYSGNENIALDINTRVVYLIKKSSSMDYVADYYYKSKGKYTVLFRSTVGCATGSSQSIRSSLLRWNR